PHPWLLLRHVPNCCRRRAEDAADNRGNAHRRADRMPPMTINSTSHVLASALQVYQKYDPSAEALPSDPKVLAEYVGKADSVEEAMLVATASMYVQSENEVRRLL